METNGRETRAGSPKFLAKKILAASSQMSEVQRQLHQIAPNCAKLHRIAGGWGEERL